MTKFTLLTFTVFLTLTLYFTSVQSVNNDYKNIDKKKVDGEKQYYLWFGPRTGRRKRNPTEDVFKNLDRDEMETLLEAIRNNPWNGLPYNSGKRHAMGFTPRLGRDSDEEMEEADFDDSIFQRSPPFAPRLGRRLSPYSPRLGRENDALIQQ